MFYESLRDDIINLYILVNCMSRLGLKHSNSDIRQVISLVLAGRAFSYRV